MKHLLIIAFFLCWLFVPQAFAQNPTPWFELAQESDYFRVAMPHQPSEQLISDLSTDYGSLSVTGRSYESSTDGAIYKLWVLTNAGDADRERKDPDAYLDGSAELVWEVLLKPVREKLPEEQRKYARMSYGAEISNKPTRGREYSLSLGAVTGAVEFYIAESRLYVLLAAYPAGGASEAKRFFDSFKLDPNLPGSLSVVVPKIGAGVAEAANPSSEQQILRSGEVTERARVLEKPEPSYTESARKFSVTGTVVLRAVFSKDGEVTNINIIRRLPHGLTEKAINAARMIKFRPAMKDGQPASTWMQLEYNFNLY